MCRWVMFNVLFVYFDNLLALVSKLHICPCSATQNYSEELTSVVKSGVVAALAGLIYGGLPASRQARQRYIQISQAEIYTGRVDAVVSGICIWTNSERVRVREKG